MTSRNQTIKLPSKLGAFASRPASSEAAAAIPLAVTKAPAGGRGRIKEGTGNVGVTLRLSRDDWMRVHQLALQEGTSINTLALDAISQVLRAKGLDPLKGGSGS